MSIRYCRISVILDIAFSFPDIARDKSKFTFFVFNRIMPYVCIALNGSNKKSKTDSPVRYQLFKEIHSKPTFTILEHTKVE